METFNIALLMVRVLSVIAYDCIFSDKSGSTSSKLNLAYFMDNNVSMELMYHSKDDDAYHNYTYSPCSNSLSCPHSNLSLGQLKVLTASECQIISRFDDEVEPIYNLKTRSWHFHYEDGDVCSNSIPRKVNITWFCRLDEDAFIDSVDAVEDNDCVYQMNIQSHWACLSFIDSQTFWTSENIFYFVAIPLCVIILAICLLLMRKSSHTSNPYIMIGDGSVGTEPIN